MKHLLFTSLAGLALLTGCMQSTVTEEELLVAPNTVPCSEGAAQMCALVKWVENGQLTATWVKFGSPIQGFTPESGFRHDLIVTVTTFTAGFIGDPPPPDYRLKRIVSKTPDSTFYSPGQP